MSIFRWYIRRLVLEAYPGEGLGVQQGTGTDSATVCDNLNLQAKKLDKIDKKIFFPQITLVLPSHILQIKNGTHKMWIRLTIKLYCTFNGLVSHRAIVCTQNNLIKKDCKATVKTFRFTTTLNTLKWGMSWFRIEFESDMY